MKKQRINTSQKPTASHCLPLSLNEESVPSETISKATTRQRMTAIMPLLLCRFPSVSERANNRVQSLKPALKVMTMRSRDVRVPANPRRPLVRGIPQAALNLREAETHSADSSFQEEKDNKVTQFGPFTRRWKAITKGFIPASPLIK